MSTAIGEWYDGYLRAHNAGGIEIPFTAVKLYRKDEEVPAEVRAMDTSGVVLNVADRDIPETRRAQDRPDGSCAAVDLECVLGEPVSKLVANLIGVARLKIRDA